MVSWSDDQLRLHQLRLKVEQAKRIGPEPEPEDLKDEEELHNQIIRYCRDRKWIYYHGSMAHRTKRTRGEPDFSIRADGGRVFDIECKKPGGKLSPHQLANKVACECLGHTVHVIESYSEFLKIVETNNNKA